MRTIKHLGFKLRLSFILILPVILFTACIFFPASLQTDKVQHTEKTPVPAVRGNIYDREGYPIAMSETGSSLYYLPPGRNPDKNEAVQLAKQLEKIFSKYGKSSKKTLHAEQIIRRMDVGFNLHTEKAKIVKPLSSSRKIKVNLSKKEMTYIRKHRSSFKNVKIKNEQIRVYDQASIAAQTVGYIKPFRDVESLKPYKNRQGTYAPMDFVGADGIELMYQKELSGEKGYNSGDGSKMIKKPKKGNHLFLTIDKDVQLAAEKAITEHLKRLRDKSKVNETEYAPFAHTGYAVAIEVETGQVVAMASMPDYDPNVWTNGSSYQKVNKIKPYITNGTIMKSTSDHPAGLSSLGYMASTIKPLSVLIGLNERLFNPEDTFTGSSGKTINPANAIEQSSNAFMAAMVAMPLYDKYHGKGDQLFNVWSDYLAGFGLGVKTESGLPGEIAGINGFKKDAASRNTITAIVNASWGQNEKYTTLQLAQYASTIANHGKRIKPQLVRKITDANGHVIQQVKPTVLNEEVFPKQYWRTMIQGMKSHAKGIEELPFPVARKSGTSSIEVNGKLVNNALFIAFAPIKNPKLAVAVVVPGGGSGIYGAAPIAAKIFSAYERHVGGLQ